ncbi:MAG: glycoside hydrolase family 3 N-terminal domain-containing protein [Elusimicrobiales bacterium]|nr:glycoside hydrolase family 3 N-terminal domain-containing protein [Elusimicrobiales bacterium]
MNIERKLARLIFPGFRFGETDPEDARRLVDMGIGGFCLYQGKVEAICDFTAELQARAAEPLLFCADYEDGPGRWALGASELPSNMAIGAAGAEEFSRRKAEITAREARALGVDWVFAPVADLATRKENPIVNVRAFGDEPRDAARLAGAYMAGLASGGTLNSIKHFPGHGETEKDSHLALPSLKRSPAQLEECELKPFAANLPAADSVMIGHLLVDDIDPEFPASFSKKIIGGLLRGKMGYKGCVVTDALSMKAINDEDAAGVSALRAGADVLLVPDDPFKLHRALLEAFRKGSISEKDADTALGRIQAMLAGISGAGPRPGREAIGSAGHRAFNAEIASDCLAWIKKSAQPALRKGETVAYLEPGNPDPAQWKGKAFVEELRRQGVEVKPARDVSGGRLLAVSFSRPQAFSGHINLSPENRAEIEKRLGADGRMTMVAFGSPFVFESFAGRLDAALCAFCAIEEFQTAAARILAGAAQARGKVPVKLKGSNWSCSAAV